MTEQRGTAGEAYEVLAVRYGTRQTTAAEVFLGYAGYGEPDRPLGMDYYFWVARNQARTIVIDTGFSPAGGAARGRTTLYPLPAALAAAGLTADEVGQVVVTHAHYDHVGGLPAFGAAEVLMTAPEYEFWTGPMGGRGLFAHVTEADEIDHLRSLRAAGRLTLTGRSHAVAPGIEMTEVGGHTPGQAIVTVATERGTVLLASDAAHYYEELDRDRPFSTVTDVPGMYAAYDVIRSLAADPSVTVVAGHDPLVAERFPAVADGVWLLSG
ncbi:MAG: N-acyl homoserine lactonase family protein [Nocardiopsaceae bacterium]|nr:N-acyl homoserine lactonase family protein [Nocardiopsaceae bacterium]